VIILRLALVLLLYGFLFNLVAALRRDLARAAAQARPSPAAGPSPAAPIGARLFVLDGGAAGLASGRTIPLIGDTLLGRAPGSDIRLDDELVSARHARLFPRDGRWLLADLGSTNGTLLNDEAFDGERPVEYGDVISIGSVRLKLAR
jgi:hypothetical protein